MALRGQERETPLMLLQILTLLPYVAIGSTLLLAACVAAVIVSQPARTRAAGFAL